MAEATETAKVVIKGDTKRAVAEAKKLEREMHKLEGRVERLQGSNERLEASIERKRMRLQGLKTDWKGVGLKMAAFAAAAVGAVRAIDEVADRAVRLNAVMQNLGDISLRGAREATKGMVSDFDLAKAAITAQRLEVVKSSEEFTRLTAVATKLGLTSGITATQGVQDFTTALARQSPMILDNLGITLKLSEAYDTYAARLGKTASQLSDAEKKQAFMTIAMEKAEEKAAGLNIEMDAQTQALVEAKTEMANLRDNVLPILAQGFGILAGAINEAAAAMGRLTNLTTALNDARQQVERTVVDAKLGAVAEERFQLAGGQFMRDSLARGSRDISILGSGAAIQRRMDQFVSEQQGRRGRRGRGGRGRRGPPTVSQFDRFDFGQEDIGAQMLEAEAEARRKNIELLEAEGLGVAKVLEMKAELAEFEGNEHEAALLRAESRRELGEQMVETVKDQKEREKEAVEEAEKAKQQAWANSARAAQTMAGITAGVLDTVVRASGASGEKLVRMQERVDAAKMFIAAGVETVEAARSFASYDFVAGAAHVAAAALATTTGILIASGAMRDKANAAGRVSGGNAFVGGSGAGDFGGFGGSNNGIEEPSIPISPVDEDLARSNGTGRTGRTRSNGSPPLVNNGTIIGGTPSQVGKALRRLMDEGSRNAGDQI